MQFKVDDEIVFELTETQKKILQHEIKSEIFVADLKRRVRWVIEHKLKNTMSRFKTQALPILKENNVQNIPLDDEKFAELVFKQSNYKNRSEREKEKRDNKEAKKDK